MRCKEMISAVLSVMLVGSVATADFGHRDEFGPSWESGIGYTVQDWGLHDDDGDGDTAPAQPLTADNSYTNPYGDPTCVWETSANGMVSWSATAMGSHPAWVDEIWGGMVQMSGMGSAALTATVDPGTQDGPLNIWVEYDWYHYGDISAGIAGAVDITPASYYDHQIGMSGSDHEWYRSIQVFEFAENPDAAFDVVFTATGFAPMLDSFEISTAIGAAVPPDMPVPEPVTGALLAAGGLGALLRRGRRGARSSRESCQRVAD